MASTVIGQNTGRLSTRIAPPACRMALVGCSRTPLIAIASAPADQRLVDQQLQVPVEDDAAVLPLIE